nr:hypothetical protein [Aeromonas caviae]
MAQALAGFMARAAEKLRAEEMCCQRVHLFVRTSPFDEQAPITSSRPAFGWSAQPMTPVCCCSK